MFRARERIALLYSTETFPLESTAMKGMKGALFCLGISVSTYAAPPDDYGTGDGVQPASWPEGSTINVYIPLVLEPGSPRISDVASIIAGINAWDTILPNITVEYHMGDPPIGASNPVNIDFRDLPGPGVNARATTTPFPDSNDIDKEFDLGRGQIEIQPGVLGNSSFMQNLACHEFGHILGFGDDLSSLGRDSCMDPVIRRNDPCQSVIAEGYV